MLPPLYPHIDLPEDYFGSLIVSPITFHKANHHGSLILNL